MEETARFKRVNAISTHVTSSRSGEGVSMEGGFASASAAFPLDAAWVSPEHLLLLALLLLLRVPPYAQTRPSTLAQHVGPQHGGGRRLPRSRVPIPTSPPSCSAVQVDEAVSFVMRERKGRDVFLIGAANVGKSAFVKAMLKVRGSCRLCCCCCSSSSSSSSSCCCCSCLARQDLGSAQSRNFNPAALAAGRQLPVESPMPGTTLSFIPIRAFADDSAIFDTPGVHLPHRLPHLLTPEENRGLTPSKRMAAYVAPAPAGREPSATAPNGGGARATYLWGGIVRIDLVSGPGGTALAFYNVGAMKVRRCLRRHGPRTGILVLRPALLPGGFCGTAAACTPGPHVAQCPRSGPNAYSQVKAVPLMGAQEHSDVLALQEGLFGAEAAAARQESGAALSAWCAPA